MDPTIEQTIDHLRALSLEEGVAWINSGGGNADQVEAWFKQLFDFAATSTIPCRSMLIDLWQEIKNQDTEDQSDEEFEANRREMWASTYDYDTFHRELYKMKYTFDSKKHARKWLMDRLPRFVRRTMIGGNYIMIKKSSSMLKSS